MNNIAAMNRIFIILLGLCFLAMLGASLYQRFARPSLTINLMAGAPETPLPDAAPTGNMELIGQLMRDVAANPKDRAKTISLVEALMAAGQWQVAENFAQKALALDDPSSSDTRPLYLLAIIHHNKGEHAQAAELLEKTLERGENPAARYSLGILYLHFLQRPEQGMAELRKGLEAPDLPDSLRNAMREELDKVEKAAAVPPGNQAESASQ